jgi:hypothetical protein
MGQESRVKQARGLLTAKIPHGRGLQRLNHSIAGD